MAKKKTSVGTAIARVIEDEHLPGSVQRGVTKALLKEGDIVDYVLEELVGGLGVKCERMYDYAKSGAYTHGLPSGQFTTGDDGLDQVIAVLEDIEGDAVSVSYSHYGAPNNLHIGWMRLFDTHGYDPTTNLLGNLTTSMGKSVYLDDMIVVVPEPDLDTIEDSSLAQWGIAARAGYTPVRISGTPASRALVKPSPVRVEESGTSEYLLVTFGYMVAGVYETDTFTIPVTGYDDEADYFHARYTVGGVVKYWMYQDDSGTYPDLDAIFDREPEPNGSFFPFAYFRYNKVSEIADTSTDAYRTSKKLVKYLGMDYDQVAEGVDENPGIEDVEQAMMMMAVPANTTNELERRYLYEFFNNLFLASAPGSAFSSETQALLHTGGATLNPMGLAAASPPTIVIQDSRFKMAIENDGVYKSRVPGNIGPVGTHSSGFTSVNKPRQAVNLWTGMTYTINTAVRYHYYRRQISLGFYEEIQVVGMRTRFYIIGKYTTIGDDEDTILIIPLDHSITEGYSVPDRELLYARSLHYVFNSVIVTRVKWYQTGIFKAIMIIVMVVIAIYTGYFDTGLFAALAAGAYSAAAVIALTMVLEYLVFQAIFKLFVKLVGVDAAFVIAIVAVAAGMVSAVDAGSIAGAPWASELLQLASGITKAMGAQIQDDYTDLLADAQSFELFKDAQNTLLDDAKALLQGNMHLDPFVIFGESPGDFYNRTVHSGNIGIVGISAISCYVDAALTLPKLNETLGEAI